MRREHLVKFGRTAECPGCLSILKGAGFQQVAARNETCRSHIKKRLVEEQQTKVEEAKRLREEDKAEEALREGRTEGSRPWTRQEDDRAGAETEFLQLRWT